MRDTERLLMLRCAVALGVPIGDVDAVVILPDRAGYQVKAYGETFHVTRPDMILGPAWTT